MRYRTKQTRKNSPLACERRLRPAPDRPRPARGAARWPPGFLAVFVAGSGMIQAAPPETKAKIDFAHDILPVISARCFHCHGPDESSRKGKLRLDQRDQAIKPRSDGSTPVKPGDPQASELVKRITSTDPEERMPPPKEGQPLKPEEIERLKQWIAEGAPYAGHWAFTKPMLPPLPKVQARDWPHNGIDYFILAKLESLNLAPAPAADPHTLVRRVALDLTGLPPALADVEAFVRNPTPAAYEALVEKLLDSPHFGERWARPWLDIARYADSAGYGSDPLRLNIWPYRDWVIQAFNRNVPYDQFTLEQIAGDLLEHPTEEQLIATAFHRNTMTNTEGGTDDEEWRVAAVKDRIGVTAQAWMGVTLHCAQCHSHKFDPISQKDYYRFYALFNQTADNDQPDERPTFPIYNAEQKRQLHSISNELAALEHQLTEDTPEFLAELGTWEKSRARGESWTPLKPEKFETQKGTELVLLEDNSLLATNSVPNRDTYTVTVRLPFTNATALRLETLPHASLPGQGPGHAGGNFVLNDLSVSFAPDTAQAARARFVRIELPGKERMLSLAEVQVFSGGSNVAVHAPATQSSTDYGGPPELAVDGNTDGRFDAAKSTTHTRAESNPWWEVDLGRELAIDRIEVWNRTDANLGDRLNGFRLLALQADRQPSFDGTQPKAALTNTVIALDGTRQIPLLKATADYSQAEFGVSKAIDGSSERKSGWAVGDQFGRAHTAIFELGELPGPGLLIVRLEQSYGDRHVLGHFRISVTDAMRPVLYTPSAIEQIVQITPAERTAAQRTELRRWYRAYAHATADLNKRIAKNRARAEAIKGIPVPIMQELAADKHRRTRLLNKGNFLDPGEELSPGLPASFGQWPEDAPSNRIAVARWLLSPDNPLTARVAVNRFWSQMFGTGMVETEEDFGTQGQLPTHPELLDWLAITFRDGVKPGSDQESDSPGRSSAWDMKALLRLIVTSATYQQSSRPSTKALAQDPRNRLLSRYPRRRLDAETVRDQALFVSGLLSPKIGGPSVYPPQPPGLWKAAFNGERTYETSKGEDRYRRGLYTIWRRTIPYPSMATFDAPSRETCTLRRLPTNTPLQAYVTLNDPVFVECAQALGRRLLQEGGQTPAERIRLGLRLALARPGQEEQIQSLLALYASEIAHYQKNEEDARKLATEPIGPLPDGVTPAEAAAWTVVGNVLLNLDGVLTKG
ncbi:MAG TPA: DUF1553 domain-containing protein [Verrucomicrobiae bacterium]|nr:DUF1553 domain-containing protein [Verrucomicrobiae bacterium]